jgi:UPF0271 protein
MVIEGKVIATNGREIEVQGNTICFHGDNPRGPEIVQSVKGALEKKGVKIVPLSQQY